MELLLKRIALRDTYTIGKLYVNGTYFCDTIEDKVRDLNKDGDLNDVGEGKIPSLTAIPYGKYEITHMAGFKIYNSSNMKVYSDDVIEENGVYSQKK